MAAGGFGQIPVKNSLGRVGDGWRMVRGLPRADLWQETGSGMRRRAGSAATGGTGRWSVCSGEATARTRPHAAQRGPMEPKGWLHSHGGGHRKGSRGGVHGRPVADQRSHRPSSACARTALAFYRWLTAPAWSPCARKGGGLDRGAAACPAGSVGTTRMAARNGASTDFELPRCACGLGACDLEKARASGCGRWARTPRGRGASARGAACGRALARLRFSAPI
jgi:hypothetical protein